MRARPGASRFPSKPAKRCARNSTPKENSRDARPTFSGSDRETRACGGAEKTGIWMMAYQFKKHYTLAAARSLLPQVRQWLERLIELRGELEKQDERLAGLLAPGRDLGGELVNQWVRTMADIKQVLLEFHSREIQLKDLDRG